VILVHAVFLFDATFTIGKRLWRGENITSPHREHNYQLLVRCGWSHVPTTLTVLMLSTGSCLAASCYARFAGPIQWSALVGTAAGLTAYAVIAHTGRLRGCARPSILP
jgi:Fuc2NAc and GlcNAc transferase